MSKDIIKTPDLLGLNLKKLRQVCGITLNEAAASAGFSKAFLSLVESGNRRIKFEDLRSLLKVYGYSLGRFVSSTQDTIEDSPYDPAAVVQGNSHSLLLDGCREEGKYHLYLLRPVRHANDIEMLGLFLPPNSQMTDENITIKAEIRGIVQKGRLLIVFQKDEFVVKEREEFCFDGRTPHIFRNYTNQPMIINLVIHPPEL